MLRLYGHILFQPCDMSVSHSTFAIDKPTAFTS